MTPTGIVLAFLTELERPGGFEAGIRRFFTPKTRYLNVGLSDTTGIEDACTFIHAFEAQTGISSMTVEMLALAEVGNKVLTERIDNLYAADGTLIMAPPVMGIFEVDGDKIVAWRDYFDTGSATGHEAGLQA